MTWANVQQNTGAGQVGAGLTATVTVSAPTTAGNKVFIACVLQSAGTVVVSGFAKDLNPKLTGSTTNQMILFSKDTAGGETSWTLTGFSSSLNAVRWIVIEVSGLATGVADKTAIHAGTTTPVASWDTGTTAATTSANELAVAVMGSLVSSGSTTYTSWSNGFVQQGAIGLQAVVSAVVILGVAFLELTSTQTTTSTVAFGTNAAGLGGVATYAESGGAPPAPTGSFLPFF